MKRKSRYDAPLKSSDVSNKDVMLALWHFYTMVLGSAQFNEVRNMKNFVKSDRKQVFGTEELDDCYLLKIKRILDERIKELTHTSQESVTMPLTDWVR